MKRALASLLFLTLGCTRVTLEPARYTCSLTAPNEQCPGGWRCLPEGFCVDPQRGGAWACTTSSDCTGGWHCGPEGRCYDRATATNVACRRGADAVEGNDCADGWTCGLDGRCLDTAVANDNRCETDVDCFGGQRCSGTRCLDAAADALRPSTQAPMFTPEGAPLRGATLVAAREQSRRRLLFGFVGNELRWFDIDPNGVSRLGAGPPLRTEPWTEPLPLEIAVIDDERGEPALLMLDPDGGVRVFSTDTRLKAQLPITWPARGIRATGDTVSAIAVLGDSRLAWGNVNDLQIETLDAGQVLDLMVDPRGLLLTTSTGAWTRPYTKPGSTQTPLPWRPAFCGLEGALRFARPMPGDRGLTLLAVVSDGGTSSVISYSSTNQPPSGNCPTEFDGVGFDYPNTVLEVPVARPREVMGDPTSLTVVGFNDRGSPAIVWIDGGVNFEALGVNQATALTTLDERGRVRLANPRASDTQPRGLVPLMPVAPPVMVQGAELLTTVPLPSKSTAVIDAVPVSQLCFTRREGSWCQSERPYGDNARATRGAPQWLSTFSTESQQMDPTFPASVMNPATATPQARQVFNSLPPTYLSAARSSDAGTLVITGGFDFISWAEVDGTAPLLRVAVSPLPRGEITDLVLTNRPPPASEASFAEGWVVSSGRVFRIFASTRALWRSSEVVLPTEVEALRVWLDGTRPRAGDRNGVVFSLDSAVALSEPLPDAGVAVDFASFCNNDFVRTEGGQLYRLVAGAGVLGVWQAVPTPGALGHLSDLGGELRVWDTEGTAYWLDGLSCAP